MNGIPENGRHWYLTYLNHHQKCLEMKRSTTDPFFLIRHDERGERDGIVILQVDDSLGIGTTKLLEDEEKTSRNFEPKARHILDTTLTVFNSIRISRSKQERFVDQNDMIENLKKTDDPKNFGSQRAATQYIGVSSRPDICANVNA